MTTATRTKSKASAKQDNGRKYPTKNHPAKNPDAPTPEQAVANRIIELLDRGELPPWEKGWTSSKMGYPQNAVSKKPYRGINMWMTVLTQMAHGYNDPRWLTYRQASGLGGHVKKGEKSTSIVFWKILDRSEKKDPNVEYLDNPNLKPEPETMLGQTDSLEIKEKKHRYPVCRLYHVFNAEQTEDCELPELKGPEAFTDPIEAAEAIIANMPNPPAFETYALANHAPHYNPERDAIRIPERGRYEQVEIYYNTVFHELTHSTGHKSRLARPGVLNIQAMSHEYGVEELIAGMGAAMLGGSAGISRETLEVDASYIRSWRDTIAADKSIVLKAAQQAQRAVDYILDYKREPKQDNESQEEPQEPQVDEKKE